MSLAWLKCPLYGAGYPSKVAERLQTDLFSMGCYELSLGDTIGAGTRDTSHGWLLQCARAVPVMAVWPDIITTPTSGDG